ncbi:DNA polymerase delta catalytic subunit [Gonapodya prolifera JEL478]|uniref:DNA polymerase n=1 Tax=Gonapodya prolifera (strain JEL478) TaxID=1344416 RepID=A0A139AJ02_GONPJ|nr:DNA polymerase delta catalytic subunit [Gonapodya prolifera JEL478]|eukprot:KXS16767.1 DNA polymerase delta catalytic subunit [Gonapodya prolifera JEL478]
MASTKRRPDQENELPEGMIPAKTTLTPSAGNLTPKANGNQTSSKRRKILGTAHGNNLEPSAFELQLQALQGGSKTERPEALWPRPTLHHLDRERDSIVFMQIEIDDVMDVPHKVIPGPRHVSRVPVLRMFGVTDAGNSIVCHVHGFFPYFYVAAPPGFTTDHVHNFQLALEDAIKRERKNVQTAVLEVRIVMKESIYHYHGNQKSPFIQIRMVDPKTIALAKRILGAGIDVHDFRNNLTFHTSFESNISYDLRFMIDNSVFGANWIELPPKSYYVRPQSERVSTVQLEVDVHCDRLVSHAPEGDWQKIAPLRILSFDIECAGRKGCFPDPQEDPVIQIANVVTVQGQSEPFIRNVFTVKSCASIVGTHVMSFEREADMLQAWRDFVVQIDPDIVTGYNVNNFDWVYLLDRAAKLKVEKFPFFSRISGSKTEAKDQHFSSKALGTRDSKALNLSGRIQFDVLNIMQREHKLRSYTLNAVSAHFLGEQKEDVDHSIITDLQNGNEETRRRLAVYCLKDAWLPQRLMDKLMSLINYIEMARVTGVSMNYLLTRGQQIKVISQLYRRALVEDLVIPAMHSEGGDEQYEGATVIEPERGYYDTPIATLDFNSLYPSIMMAHNLCYSTLVTPDLIQRYNLEKDKDYVVTPSNDMFVKPSLRKGLLATVLENLISARKKAKADLKKETDSFKRAVLDGRQLALKISANSVYGFTGATNGKLPCLEISQSTTAYGRTMIEQTRQHVEAKFCIQNGYAHDARVIYGDTDSVMVKFGETDMATVMKLGREAAEYVTQHFVKPINLEFEKVYFPYLLINKKRYAGLYWTNPTKHDKMDTKGIETVRRDSCLLVQNVLETSLRKILVERDVAGAVTYTKQIISDLLQNKIDMSQLVLTKQLTKNDYTAKQAHVELAERMRKRDPGSAPNLGDRVGYVFVKGTKDSRAYENSEDPIYVLENNLPIDTQYYLNNQLSGPLERLYEPILGDKVKSLLNGDHTRVIQVSAPSVGGLMKFAVKTATCLGCKTPLKQNETAVCAFCKPRMGELYSKQLDSMNELETRFSRLWTQCQRCQGSLHQDVICTSKDCPIFYMRKKAQKDLRDQATLLDRFETW